MRSSCPHSLGHQNCAEFSLDKAAGREGLEGVEGGREAPPVPGKDDVMKEGGRGVDPLLDGREELPSVPSSLSSSPSSWGEREGVAGGATEAEDGGGVEEGGSSQHG